MSALQHTMKSVVQRTGLSPHVIRVWEKRYGAVEPRRTASNRRLYTDAEVRRLALLHAVTRAGHSIGTIARLPDEQLRALAGWSDEVTPSAGAVNHREFSPEQCGGYMSAALAAIRRMDARAFESVLMRASLELGSQGLLQKLVAPLAGRLGELWQDGELTAAEEHFASGVVRGFLAHLARPFALPETAPSLVVATPVGQLHELGAVLVSAAASGHGWRVTHLGTSLPAVEIAGAVQRTGARALALSIVYPADDPHLPAELTALKRHLPADVAVVAGGRAAPAYASALTSVGAVVAEDLRDLYSFLDRVRRSPARAAGAR
jgi:methanogenic corrinoid protein MtbC1